jgi:hypothetical protein
MEWNIYPHEDGSGDWVVEAINHEDDGQIYTTIFSGSDTEKRAREYFDWKEAHSLVAA